MIIYIFLLVYLLFLTLVKLDKRASIYLSFFPIVIISIMRSPSVGNDAYQYTLLFQRYSNVAWNEIFSQGIEPGFVAFNKFISYFSTDGQWLLIASSLVTYYLIAKIIFKESKDITFSAFLFVSYYFYVNRLFVS